MASSHRDDQWIKLKNVVTDWIENHPKTLQLQKRLKATRQQWLDTFDPVLEVMVMEELPQSRKTFLYNRGNYDEPAHEVKAAVPSNLPPMDPDLPNSTLCSIIPKGFIIAATPLFEDLITYLPLSMALKTL